MLLNVDMLWNLKRALINSVNIVLGAVGSVLVLRIVLKLISANPTTPLVSWVYRLSDTLIYPFRDIVGNIAVPGLGVLDIVTIIAFTVYMLLGNLVLMMISNLVTPVHKTSTSYSARTYHDIEK